MSPRLSVIVLIWNGDRFVEPCLRALLAQKHPSFQILLVDNGSTDGSAALAHQIAPQAQLIRNGYNLGFAGGNNVGLAAATGDLVVFLNQDTEAQPGWLEAIDETFRQDDGIGIVGCKLLYPGSRNLQHAGAVVWPGDAFTHHIGWGEQDTGQYERLEDSPFVTGAAFAIRRSVLDRLGPLDAQYYPAFYEDVDYCYRARRAGFRVVYQPRAVVFHHETSSLAGDGLARACAFHRSRVRFVLRHWTAEELASFEKAEQQALATAGGLDDLVARARAYGENMLMAAVLSFERRRDPTLAPPLEEGQLRWLVETLQRCRSEAYRRLVTLLSEPDLAPTVSAPEQPADEWRAAIPTVPSTYPLDEAPRTKPTSLMERFEAWLAEWWIRLGRPILDRQSKINDRVAEALAELGQQDQALADAVTDQFTRREQAAQARVETALTREHTERARQQARSVEALIHLDRILTADHAAMALVLQRLVEGQASEPKRSQARGETNERGNDRG